MSRNIAILTLAGLLTVVACGGGGGGGSDASFAAKPVQVTLPEDGAGNAPLEVSGAAGALSYSIAAQAAHGVGSVTAGGVVGTGPPRTGAAATPSASASPMAAAASTLRSA